VSKYRYVHGRKSICVPFQVMEEVSGMSSGPNYTVETKENKLPPSCF